MSLLVKRDKAHTPACDTINLALETFKSTFKQETNENIISNRSFNYINDLIACNYHDLLNYLSSLTTITTITSNSPHIKDIDISNTFLDNTGPPQKEIKKTSILTYNDQIKDFIPLKTRQKLEQIQAPNSTLELASVMFNKQIKIKKFISFIKLY